MTMQYVRDTYRVPAKRGRCVRVYYRPHGWGRLPVGDPRRWVLAKEGRITSASHHLHIDGGGPYHPRYGVVYLDDDGETVLLDTRLFCDGGA